MKKTLEEWLSWQETLHLSEIDLGLERISKVAKKLNLLSPSFPIITVAGTNGKGSTVAFLDSILCAEGYKTGAFTSPHLVQYNERIVLNGNQANDDLIIRAFEEINKARLSIENEDGTFEDISLTYFEFGALAAMLIYQQQEVDVAILEVGLGGRLDAANLWDTSLAIITSIGIDHIDWLGDDRDIIAIEKSGIMRKDTPVVSGESNPPPTISSEAKRIGANLQQINMDFSYSLIHPSKTKPSNKEKWQYKNSNTTTELDLPLMQGEFQLSNAATAITGLNAIKEQLPVSLKSINQGLKNTRVQGRLQVLQCKPEWLIDVAHNPHSAKELAKYLKQKPIHGRTIALFSMLRDKNVREVIEIMRGVIDEWHIVATEGSRGLSLAELEKHFEESFDELENTQYIISDIKKNPPKSNMQKIEQSTSNNTLNCVKTYSNLSDACDTLKNITKDEDRVVAFGSFLVISEILDKFK